MGEPAFYECTSCHRRWERYELKMGWNPPRGCSNCGAGPEQQVTDQHREAAYVGAVHGPPAEAVKETGEQHVDVDARIAAICQDMLDHEPGGLEDTVETVIKKGDVEVVVTVGRRPAKSAVLVCKTCGWPIEKLDSGWTHLCGDCCERAEPDPCQQLIRGT